MKTFRRVGSSARFAFSSRLLRFPKVLRLPLPPPLFPPIWLNTSKLIFEACNASTAGQVFTEVTRVGPCKFLLLGHLHHVSFVELLERRNDFHGTADRHF